jgi:hypothetical protein
MIDEARGETPFFEFFRNESPLSSHSALFVLPPGLHKSDP